MNSFVQCNCLMIRCSLFFSAATTKVLRVGGEGQHEVIYRQINEVNFFSFMYFNKFDIRKETKLFGS